MKRTVVALVVGVLLCIILFAVFAPGRVGRAEQMGRIYSVAAIQAGLRSHPRAWIGHTVWVRGWLQRTGMGCESAVWCRFPRWLAYAPSCAGPTRCKVARWAEIQTVTPGQAPQPGLVIPWSPQLASSPSIIDSIWREAAGIPVISHFIKAPDPRYLIRILPRVQCSPLRVGRSLLPCAPDAILWVMS